MKLRTAMAAVVVVLTTSTLSAGQNLDVFVNNAETVSFRVMQSAKAFSSRVLATAQVTVEWHGAMRPTSKIANRVIVIDLRSTATAADCSRDALGFSLLDKRDRVSIFYNRVAAYGEVAAPFVLGYAIAHEIAHVLEGVSHHSASGVMKPRWDRRDIADMKHNRLRFTDEDIRMIRKVNFISDTSEVAVR